MGKKRSKPEQETGSSDSDERTTEPIEDQVSVEAAMEELGRIVRVLESGQEPLDASLKLYERGMRLMRICHHQLDSAARRIELVTRLDADGTVELDSFDGQSTLQRHSTDSFGSVERNTNSDDDASTGSGTLF
ncbi:MAG: exodeoxyribonuclease VII small subunit [Planctomycetaceae bacterium]|nr:exodeoxyribonuclease VII small subunit [Planctomycetaceae bacterium]